MTSKQGKRAIIDFMDAAQDAATALASIAEMDEDDVEELGERLVELAAQEDEEGIQRRWLEHVAGFVLVEAARLELAEDEEGEDDEEEESDEDEEDEIEIEEEPGEALEEPEEEERGPRRGRR